MHINHLVSGKIMSHLERLEKALDFQENYEIYVRSAASNIKDSLRVRKIRPEFAIVLGSGLGYLADQIVNQMVINYTDIPRFPVLTAVGHEGKLLIGEIKGVGVIGLKGRKHYYEVADEPFNTGMLQVVFPVHVLAELGVENYFATNAVGGLNRDYNVGDVMIAKTHIGKFIPDPLVGRLLNLNRVDNGKRVERFQPLDDAYNSEFSRMLYSAGSQYEGQVHFGVLSAVTGPSYETKGDAIMLRNKGADAVGMSVVPEVIVARNRGMNVVSMSCISNKIASDGGNPANHEEVMRILNAPETRERLSSIVQNFFRLYKEKCMK